MLQDVSVKFGCLTIHADSESSCLVAGYFGFRNRDEHFHKLNKTNFCEMVVNWNNTLLIFIFAVTALDWHGGNNIFVRR